MSFIKNKFLKKTICLGLSAALIYNTTVPAFGQEFFHKSFKDIEVQEIAIDNTYFDHTKADIQRDIQNAFFEEQKRKMSDDTHRRAHEIVMEILGDEQGDIIKEHFDPESKPKPKTDQELKEEYLQGIQEQANKAKEEIQETRKGLLAELKKEEAKYLAEGNFTKTEIANWKAENLANIEKNYKDAVTKIDTYFQEETDEINNDFEGFLRELKAGAEEAFFQHVKDLYNELMNLYAKEPAKVEEYILALTEVITTLVNKNKEHIYSQEQKEILLNIYRKVIERESAKVGNDKSIFTNPCETKGYCPDLTSAIFGISVLTDQRGDAKIIFDTIERYKETAANFTVLLHGISGLLTLKEYDWVRNILKKHTEEEHGFKWSYVWDKLNFMSIPQLIANAHGKYRGHVSESGDYWSEDHKYQNIYSDIALMLAEEGSEGSLKILREFGVEKCYVSKTSGVKKETLAKYSISCGGIKPFLVGALLSGKSGAGKYSLPKPIYGAQYMTSDGRTHNFDQNTYNYAMQKINNTESNYYGLAQEAFNGDAEAMLALYIMNEGMGDLNVQEEFSLDNTLYEAFKGRIPERFLKSKYIIIDNERRSKKENRKITVAVTTGIGMFADIYVAVQFVAGIFNIAHKAFSLGKGVFNAFRMAKVGLTVKNIPALAKVAARYTKTAFMRQKIVVKATNFGKKLKNASKGYKDAVRLNVLRNSAQYTNAVRNQVQGSLAALDVVPNLSQGLAGAVKGVRYDKGLGVFVLLNESGEALNLSGVTQGLNGLVKGIKFDKDIGTFVLLKNAETPTQVAEVVDEIVSSAMTNAKSRYRVSKLFKKGANFKELFLEEVNKLVAASPLRAEDQRFLAEFFKGTDFEVALGEADTHIINLAKSAKSAKDLAENPVSLPGYLEGGSQNRTRIGVDFIIGEKMPSFSEQLPKFVSMVEEDGRMVLKFFKNENEALDLSAFKLVFEDPESVGAFARASARLGEAGKIDLKFIPKEANSFWTRNFRNVFARNKEKLFGGTGTVTLVKDGKQIETGITLRTYKKYDGLKVFVNEDLGGAISVFKGAEQLPVTTKDAFFLPKYQIRNFLNFAKETGIEAPWKIKLMGGVNKVNALYLQSMVSLSVASTGLVYPLSRNYPEMDMKELTFISLIAPYLLSAATPFVSPFVKKFGAIKMLKTSMYLSLGSLAIPVLSGFNGFGGIQADNPFSKPSPYLLYPSALLIGLATTLTRGSFSPLIQSIGGGSGTLKAVAFKSISSFMLVLPPIIGAGIDQIRPKYFTNPDGSYYLDANGQPIQKHWFDFSFSYPVMLAIAGAALYKLQKVHFNQKIGRSPNAFTTTREFFKDVGSSYGLLFRKDLLPLTLSSALLAGAESSLLYTYSNSMASEYVRNKISTEELVPVIALLGLNAPAFITRMNSKPILRAMGGDNILGYRNLLTASLLSAGAGSYLLATQDDPLSFALGLTLTSIGFSNITSSILRYGHSKLATELNAPKHMVTSWDVSYPTIYIGMSAVPYLYGYMNDRNIDGLQTKDKFDMVSLKNTSWQEVMDVPLIALGLGAALSYFGMHSKPALKTVNGGGLLAPLGLVAESHNPGLRTLVSPMPATTFNSPNLNLGPKLKTFDPHLEYRPDLITPAFQVTPNLSIEPMNR